jgi:hypothetical protein
LGQFVALQHSVRNEPNLCKSSCHEIASQFFVTNAPDPPHWTLNSCFGVFRTIWVHLVPFGYLTKLGAKWAEVLQNFVPWSRVGIFHNKPLDPPHWTLTSCFVVCRTIWVHLGQFVALPHSVQNGPNWCKSSCHEVASEFFTTNAPDPPHGTLNSCFGVFCTIWMHLGPFGCLTKLNGKLAKLVQKFVPRSRVGIFRSERTRSTPLDSKLMFWCVLYYLDAFGPFGCLTKLNAKRAELVQKLVPRSRVLSFRIRHTRLSPLGPKLLFWCVSYYLGTFGTVWLPYKTRCKTGRCFAKVRAMQSCRNVSHTNTTDPPFWTLTSCVRCISYYLVAFGIVCCITTLSSKWAKLVQKFVPRSRVGILRNERTWSTPLDSKLMFWSVLYYLGAFGTIWLPYKTLCKTSCHVVVSEFFTTNHSINAIGP